MSETKFTPGPWHPGHMVNDSTPCNCRGIVDEGRYAGGIATVHKHNGIARIDEGGNDCPPEEEAIANAHLIASAPDLYEALEAVKEFLPIGFVATGRPDGASDRNIELSEARAKMDAALAKARGE